MWLWWLTLLLLCINWAVFVFNSIVVWRQRRHWERINEQYQVLSRAWSKLEAEYDRVWPNPVRVAVPGDIDEVGV